jgi:hypothetical protein
MITSAMMCVEVREELQRAEQEKLQIEECSQQKELHPQKQTNGNKSPMSPLMDTCDWIDNYTNERRSSNHSSTLAVFNTGAAAATAPVLLHPSSAAGKTTTGTAHDFKPRTFMQPVPCAICEHAIWGVSDRGHHCDLCGLDIHQKCIQQQGGNGENNNHIPDNIRNCNRMLVARQQRLSQQGALEHPLITADGASRQASNNDNGAEYEILGDQITLPRRVGTLTDRHSIGKVTMQRLTRRTFEGNGSIDATMFAETAAATAVSTAPKPQSNSPGGGKSTGKANQPHFQRRIHPFRGHEFQATYLEADGMQTSFDCQRCGKVLGDNGVQCYQCRCKN